jgi:hypothetical protein
MSFDPTSDYIPAPDPQTSNAAPGPVGVMAPSEFTDKPLNPALAQQDVSSEPSYPAAPGDNPNTHGWRAVLRGALSGLENHLKGAGEGLIAGGIPGALVGAVNPQMADTVLRNRGAIQQAQVQTAQAQAAGAQQANAIAKDNHEAQMGLFHINLLEAQRAYDVAPKSVQDMLDKQEEEFVGKLKLEGFQPIQSGIESASDAQNIALARNQTDSDSAAFAYVPLRTADGSWSIFHISSPGQPLQKDSSLPLLKADGTVGSIPVRAGSMSVGQFMQLYTQRVNDIGKQQGAAAAKIEISNATGATEKNKALADKAENSANAPAKVENLLVGSDAAGNQVAGTKDELTASGIKNISKLPAADASKVVAARELVSPDGLFSLIASDMKALGPQGLNAVGSRFNEFMAGRVGEGNDNYTRLRTHVRLLSSALMQAHVGSRGSEAMLEEFRGLADQGRMSSSTLKSALAAEYDYVHGRALLPRKAAQ